MLLAFVVVFPAVCAYFLKSSGSSMFLSVCASFVLVNLASSNIGNLLHRNNIESITPSMANLILVFFPLLVTMLLTRKHVNSQVGVLISVLAGLCAGGLAVLTTEPFFSSTLLPEVSNSAIWTNVQKIQTWIISAGAISSYLLMWTAKRSHSSKHSK